MCTAQVLLLNRDVMRRNFGDVNRRVCRKLFDSNESNAVEPSTFLKKMQEDHHKKDALKWNFDFMTETPLPGRFQWEPVFTTTVPSSKQQQTTVMESNRVSAEPIVNEIRREVTASTSKRKKKNAGVLSQYKITDFMPKRKKYNSDECSSSKLKVRRVNRNIESLASTTRLR